MIAKPNHKLDLGEWQEAAFKLIAARHLGTDLDEFRDTYSPSHFNRAHGFYINMGRHSGHSTLALRMLRLFPTGMIIVPHVSMKSYLAARLKTDDLELLTDRIWVAQRADTFRAKNGDGITIDDVKTKSFQPFSDADICIVDSASGISEDTLELIRSVPFRTYVELG